MTRVNRKLISAAALAVLVTMATAPAARAASCDADCTARCERQRNVCDKIADESVKLVLKGDTYTVTVGGETDKGTVKADKAAKPITLDITSSEGPNKGKTILAICEHKGDTMTVCYDLTGKERPCVVTTGSPAHSASLAVVWAV